MIGDWQAEGWVFESPCCKKMFCDRCARIYLRHFKTSTSLDRSYIFMDYLSRLIKEE